MGSGSQFLQAVLSFPRSSVGMHTRDSTLYLALLRWSLRFQFSRDRSGVYPARDTGSRAGATTCGRRKRHAFDSDEQAGTYAIKCPCVDKGV